MLGNTSSVSSTHTPYMRFIIKCLSESGFDFPPGTDFRIFFPERCSVAMENASVVVVTLPLGPGHVQIWELHGYC